jgi:hypothetical protein
MVLEHLLTLGPVRGGLDVERAVDVLWFFNDPAHHGALVGRQGWPVADYRSWLAERMRGALLGG